MIQVWRCTNCGQQNHDSQFCSQCGQQKSVPTRLSGGVRRWCVLGVCALLALGLGVGIGQWLLHKPVQDAQAPASSEALPEASAPAEPESVVPDSAAQAPESGSYPIGSRLELFAGKGATIYYALGGAEVDNLPLSEFTKYETPILLPPYESKLRIYSKNALGIQSEERVYTYQVEDDATVQQIYEQDEALRKTMDALAMVGPFESPEKLTQEQLLLFALYLRKAPSIAHQINGRGTDLLFHRADLNTVLSDCFDGRTSSLDAGVETQEAQVEYYAQFDSFQNFYGQDGPLSEPQNDIYSFYDGTVHRNVNVFSLVELENGTVESIVTCDGSDYYGRYMAGRTSGNGFSFSLEDRSQHQSTAVQPHLRTDIGIDEAAVARMNIGMYPNAYRYVLIPRSDGSYLPESCEEISLSAPAYAPVVYASVPSGATISPESFLRLASDAVWIDDIYYSYDGVSYQPYQGALTDLPQEDFSLYAYVQRKDAQGNSLVGRVSRFDYKTFALGDQLRTQLQLFQAAENPPTEMEKDDLLTTLIVYATPPPLPESLTQIDAEKYPIVQSGMPWWYGEDLRQLASDVTCGRVTLTREDCAAHTREPYIPELDLFVQPATCGYGLTAPPVPLEYRKQGDQIIATIGMGIIWSGDGTSNIQLVGSFEYSDLSGADYDLKQLDAQLPPEKRDDANRIRVAAMQDFDKVAWRRLVFTYDPAWDNYYLSACETLAQGTENWYR